MNRYFSYTHKGLADRLRISKMRHSKGSVCELAGVNAGDMVRIGGKLQEQDQRVFKFISAEWDGNTGECYAYVQAPDAPHPVRVLASGVTKIKGKF